MLSSFVAVDTETTGLDFERDRVIEIAAVRFEDGEPVAEFEALVSPGDRNLSVVSRLITGIDPAELDAAPPASETLAAFLRFAGAHPLVAHNAPFDAHFIRRAMEAEGLAAPAGPWLDSLTMARAAWPEWDSHKLDALAGRIELARDGEHRALPDARRAGGVFLAAQRTVLAKASAQGLRDLARLAADLPGWNLVFDGEAPAESVSMQGGREHAENDEEGEASSRSSGFPVTESGAGEFPGAAAAGAIAGALVAGGTSVVETPAGSDEHAAGLRAALEAASAGDGSRRILLAVPDPAALGVLLRSGAARAAGDAMAMLGTPADYPDRARLAALAENPARAPVEEREALLPLIAWADRFPGRPLQVSRALSPDRNRLSWSRVRCEAWGDDEAAMGARARAERAGVVIVTHAALCAHVALDGALLPACDALVVTGAHRLPDAALEGAGRRVALFRLRDALQPLRLAPDRDEGAWADVAPEIPEAEREAWKERWFAPEREFQKFLQKAGRRAEKLRAQGDFRVRYEEHAALAFGADPAPVLEALRANEALLETVVQAPVPAASREARRILSRLRAFRADFDFLCAARDPGWTHWFEDVSNPHKAALRAIPRDMGSFGETLAGLFEARVFASPALLARSAEDPARDAAFALRSAGLAGPDEQVAVHAVADPAAPSPAPRLVMAPFAPSTGSGEQAAGFARFLLETAGAFAEGGILVFCPSQTALRNLREALRPLLTDGTPLWAQHIDGNRDALTRLYNSGRGGWVLATEGLADLRDASGRAPALWILTRLPFPPPRDPVLEARGDLSRSGREPWRAAAILRVRREWHALNKAGAAPQVVWLLDARASGDGLGARLAQATGWKAEVAGDVEELWKISQHHGITTT